MEFAGERLIPDAADVEPTCQRKTYQEHVSRYHFADFFASGKRGLDVRCRVAYGNERVERKPPEASDGLDVAEDATLDGQVTRLEIETGECKDLRVSAS